MERDLADIKRYPCGRVEVSVKLNRILLCSPETYLEVIDPDSLEATGKIGFRTAQYIYDFVVDDVRGQVAVLALESGSIRLRIYSLPDGANLQQLAFPAVSIRGMKLALIPKTGQLAVALDLDTRGVGKSDIYLCNSEVALDCKKATRIDWVGQMSLLGNELLAAKNAYPDN
jgi:hypothetical protein